MGYRIIQGLHFAAPCSRPQGIPALKRRPKGSKGQGLRYEKELARQFPSALHNPWYHFRDQNGSGFCSPDLVWQPGNTLVVLEAKLTNVEEAQGQLENLYFPVLAMAHGIRPNGAIVVKHLSPGIDLRRVVTSMGEAVAMMAFGRIPILHWLGHSPLIPPSERS